MSSDDEDYFLGLFGPDPVPGEKQSAYDVAYEAFSAYVDFIKPASHTHSRVTNYQGKLVCTVVDIFNKTPRHNFIDEIVKYAYNLQSPNGDPVFYCAVIDYVANILHSKRDKVDGSPPKMCRLLVEAYRRQEELEKELAASARPKDPRLAQVIPGVVRVAPPSTFVPRPKPMAAAPSQPEPLINNARTCDTAPWIENPEPDYEEYREPPVPEPPRRKSSSRPSSSQASKRPSNEEPPPRAKQTRTEASRTPEPVDLSTMEGFVDARLQLCTQDCPAFLEYMTQAVTDSTDDDMKNIAPGQHFQLLAPLDSAFAVMKPPPISIEEWKEEGAKSRADTGRHFKAQLKEMDAAIASNCRLTDIIISDFALAKKRDLLEYTVHFSIDYPDHWKTAISKLYKIPKMNVAPKSIAICVGLEFAVRFDSFDCALSELMDFYNDFFKFYYTAFIKNPYTVKRHKKSNNELSEYGAVPPKIIVITVPLIKDSKYPSEYVRRLNDHIRKIVDEKQPTFGMIVLYDWEKETLNVPEFTEDNYHTRFVRLYGYLQHEQTFFDATRMAMLEKQREIDAKKEQRRSRR
uniref:CID domain-containing protein n=1 Tax=Panagrellus redivivus TaxID=6233 RepID=A0A7E4VDD2_PANRE